MQETNLKKKQKHSLLKRIWIFIINLHLWFLGIIFVLVLFYNFTNPPFTTLMIQRKIIRGYPVKMVKFIPIEKIPKKTYSMLVNLEDSNFAEHWGFNFEQIKHAYKVNKRRHRIKLGGSTITNQVARSLFLTTDRNYLRKYMEFWISTELELLMPKRRILELYLNYIEWGKGIFGIEQASLKYYGKSVTKLNREQSIRLVTIVPNPIRYNVSNFSKNAILRHRYAILEMYY
jgi:monofunctional glycosyltransferase